MPIAPQLVALVDKLPNAEHNGDSSELFGKICSMIPRHGLNNILIVKLLTFINNTRTIKTFAKVNFIKEYLLPNDYLNQEVLNALMAILQNDKYHENNMLHTYENETKPLQIACSQWLINTYFLWPEDCVEKSIYMWFAFWATSYLQDYFTLLIILSSNCETDVKAWRIRKMWDLSEREGYVNGKRNLSFILKRYKFLVEPDTDNGHVERIHNMLLSDLEIDENVKPDITWDSKFISQLTGILIQENPYKFSVSIVKRKLSDLTLKLSNNDSSANRSAASPKRIQLYDVKKVDQLIENWNNLKLPLNVEPIITSKLSAPILKHIFILSKINSNNKETEKFCNSLFSWIDKNLTRCFYEKSMGRDEMLKIINYTTRTCEIYDFLTFKIIDKLLVGDNLIANKYVFIELAYKLFLLLSPKKEDLKMIHERILAILSSTLMLNSEKRFTVDKDPTFAILSQSILLMLQNWLRRYENDHDTIMMITHLINGIAKLFLLKLQNSVENRYYSINMIMLLNLLIDISQNKQIISILDSNEFWNVLLQPKIVEQIRLLDDPLMLDILCQYLNSMIGVVQVKLPKQKVVQLINSYILDLTNYLWRNKVDSSKRLFNIPTEFIKIVADRTFFPNITNVNEKIKTIFSLLGIPALSFIAYTTLREIENDESPNVHYNNILNEKIFNKFIKNLKRKGITYIKDVNNFDDLKIRLLKKFYKLEPYQGIIIFLCTYMKALKKYRDELAQEIE